MADTAQTTPTIEFSTDGTISQPQHDHAVDVVLRALERRHLTATHARFRLEAPEAPSTAPAHARVVVELPGKSLAVHADADQLDEAITEMGAKLDQRIEHTFGKRAAKRLRAAQTPNAWHHGDS